MAEIVTLPTFNERAWNNYSRNLKEALIARGFPREKAEWMLADMKQRVMPLIPSDDCVVSGERAFEWYMEQIGLLESELYDAIHARPMPGPKPVA
jgi:hypothetical protein